MAIVERKIQLSAWPERKFWRWKLGAAVDTTTPKKKLPSSHTLVLAWQQAVSGQLKGLNKNLQFDCSCTIWNPASSTVSITSLKDAGAVLLWDLWWSSSLLITCRRTFLWVPSNSMHQLQLNTKWKTILEHLLGKGSPTNTKKQRSWLGNWPSRPNSFSAPPRSTRPRTESDCFWYVVACLMDISTITREPQRA